MQVRAFGQCVSGKTLKGFHSATFETSNQDLGNRLSLMHMP